MKINDRIEQFVKQVKDESLTVSVVYGFMYGVVEKIDRALRNANEEDRFSLAIDLFRLWFEAGMCSKKERQEEAQSIFGQIFNEHGDKRLMYTLTADGKQLRVWYGRPACMDSDYVDSCGENLLFGVYGHPEIVKRYLQALCEIHGLGEIRVPNGVRLYMHWRH
ncbi:MAG: hypothetical protein KBC21_04100 [Candidatus Pacebacteria bacterium]|jgi:hypothetical protein|nr:hypothetical protein [Candidatus Paceibacterota bacterium]